MVFWITLTSSRFEKSNTNKLTAIDKVKIANVIVINVKKDLITVITGITKGTAIYTAFKRLYFIKKIGYKINL